MYIYVCIAQIAKMMNNVHNSKEFQLQNWTGSKLQEENFCNTFLSI